MKTIVEYKVKYVHHSEEGRVADLVRKPAPGEPGRYSFSRDVSVSVPDEVFCDPGDTITMTLGWPDHD